MSQSSFSLLHVYNFLSYITNIYIYIYIFIITHMKDRYENLSRITLPERK